METSRQGIEVTLNKDALIAWLHFEHRYNEIDIDKLTVKQESVDILDELISLLKDVREKGYLSSIHDRIMMRLVRLRERILEKMNKISSPSQLSISVSEIRNSAGPAQDKVDSAPIRKQVATSDIEKVYTTLNQFVNIFHDQSKNFSSFISTLPAILEKQQTQINRILDIVENMGKVANDQSRDAVEETNKNHQSYSASCTRDKFDPTTDLSVPTGDRRVRWSELTLHTNDDQMSPSQGVNTKDYGIYMTLHTGVSIPDSYFQCNTLCDKLIQVFNRKEYQERNPRELNEIFRHWALKFTPDINANKYFNHQEVISKWIEVVMDGSPELDNVSPTSSLDVLTFRIKDFTLNFEKILAFLQFESNEESTCVNPYDLTEEQNNWLLQLIHPNCRGLLVSKVTLDTFSHEEEYQMPPTQSERGKKRHRKKCVCYVCGIGHHPPSECFFITHPNANTNPHIPWQDSSSGKIWKAYGYNSLTVNHMLYNGILIDSTPDVRRPIEKKMRKRIKDRKISLGKRTSNIYKLLDKMPFPKIGIPCDHLSNFINHYQW